MNNYFVTKEELKEELDTMRDKMFTVIARAFWQLEHKVSLLVNIGFPKKDSTEIKGEKQMSEKKIEGLMERLWTVADALDNKELIGIVKELEAYVEKTTSNLKKFNDELKGLMGRIKALEEKRE